MVVQSPTLEHAAQTDLYTGATDPHFEILDCLIEAGGAPIAAIYAAIR